MILPILLIGSALAQNETAAPTLGPTPSQAPTAAPVAPVPPQVPLPNAVEGSMAPGDGGIIFNYTALFAPCAERVRTVRVDVDPRKNVTVASLDWPVTAYNTVVFRGLVAQTRPSAFLLRGPDQQARFTVSGEFLEVSLWCGPTRVLLKRPHHHPHQYCPGAAHTIMQEQVALGWTVGEGLGVLFLVTWVFLIAYYFYYLCKRVEGGHTALLSTEMPEYHVSGNSPETPPGV